MLLLTIFLAQFTINQRINNRLILVDSDITSFVQEVKYNGGITSSMAASLENQIKADLKDDSITVTITPIVGDSAHTPYGELIEYHISYEVKNAIAGKNLFHLSDDDAAIQKKREGKTISEYWE